MGICDSKGRFLKQILSITSAILLATPTCAQEVSPHLLTIARAAYHQQQEQKKEDQQKEQDWLFVPVNIRPKLIGKKVSVQVNSGARYKGKLIKMDGYGLRLKAGREEIALPFIDIAWIEYEKRNIWLGSRGVMYPVRLTQELKEKKVEIVDRDGQFYKGLLIEVSPEALHIKDGADVTKLPVTEVKSIAVQTGYRWRKNALVGGSAIALLVILILLTREGEG